MITPVFIPLIRISSSSPLSSKEATDSDKEVENSASIIAQSTPTVSLHPMQTRSYSEIFKPKVYSADLLQELHNVVLALKIPHCKTTMETEYQGLIRIGTWTLVPPNVSPHAL